jgi:hypothetical protein
MNILDGLRICTTSLTTEEKRELNRLVKNHGGLFCNALDPKVTHLVAGVVGSEK